MEVAQSSRNSPLGHDDSGEKEAAMRTDEERRPDEPGDAV